MRPGTGGVCALVLLAACGGSDGPSGPTASTDFTIRRVADTGGPEMSVRLARDPLSGALFVLRRSGDVFRLAVPGQGTATVERLYGPAETGVSDAQGMAFASDGSLYIVTKGEKGGVALYRFPRDLKSGPAMPLQRVAKPRDPGKSPNSERVTDATASPDGEWIVLRTSRAVTFHHTKELMGGNWRPAHVVDLADLDEPQGEGVTLTTDGTLVVVGEGGGKSAPGTLARLSCSSLR